MQKATTINEYIGLYPGEVQARLVQMRATIQKAAPHAKEAIKYGIPTFTLEGNLVHFGASKNHIGFYPAPSGIQAFRTELAGYVTSKGAIQFPNDQPLPLRLIAKIVRFRVAENKAGAVVKARPGKRRQGSVHP